jgi:hypothetical protein
VGLGAFVISAPLMARAFAAERKVMARAKCRLNAYIGPGASDRGDRRPGCTRDAGCSKLPPSHRPLGTVRIASVLITQRA